MLFLDSMFWKHPMMLHCKEPITSPLTTLPSEDLQLKATEMFKVRWIRNITPGTCFQQQEPLFYEQRTVDHEQQDANVKVLEVYYPYLFILGNHEWLPR